MFYYSARIHIGTYDNFTQMKHTDRGSRFLRNIGPDRRPFLKRLYLDKNLVRRGSGLSGEWLVSVSEEEYRHLRESLGDGFCLVPGTKKEHILVLSVRPIDGVPSVRQVPGRLFRVVF
jgi:hypothetical protein